MERDAIVPIENSMCVIYHNPLKRSCTCNQKTKHSNNLIYKNVNWPQDIYYGQDAVFHRIINTTGSDKQRTPFSYVDEQMTTKTYKR